MNESENETKTRRKPMKTKLLAGVESDRKGNDCGFYNDVRKHKKLEFTLVEKRKDVFTYSQYFDVVPNEQNQFPQSMGDFIHIPLEVMHLIFDYLSIRELSCVSMVSKAMRDLVENYSIHSKIGYTKLIPKSLIAKDKFVDWQKPKEANEELRRYELFRELGLLLKRTTCLYPTIWRLKIFAEFIKKLMVRLPDVDFVHKYGTQIRFILKCIGTLLHIMISGWDESECEFVFRFLEDMFQLGPIVRKCLESSVGNRKHEEYFIRSYYRLICLDLCGSLTDKSYWLSLILQQNSSDCHLAQSRAKIMMIIYGPLLGNELNDIPTIAWWDLTDSLFIEDGLKELGFAFHLLLSHTDKRLEWSNNVIVAIINAVIKLPDRWLFENIATVLFYSGDEIVKLILKYHLMNGRISDVANFIVYLALITCKFKQDEAWILGLIDSCYNSPVCEDMKRNLLSEIPIAFNEAMSDIEHSIDADDERDVTELHDMMNATTSLIKALLQIAYPLSSGNSDSDRKTTNCEE